MIHCFTFEQIFVFSNLQFSFRSMYCCFSSRVSQYRWGVVTEYGAIRQFVCPYDRIF
jgi:hypothetical protein